MEVENNNEDQMPVKPVWLKEKARRMEEILVREGNLREKIWKAQKKDEGVVRVVKELKKAEVESLKKEEWSIEE